MKKIFVFGLTSLALCLGVVSLSSLINSNPFHALGDDFDIERTYDLTNTPSEANETYSSFNHTYEEYVTLRYENAKRADYAHIELGLNGSISKVGINNQSNNLKVINVTYTGDIRVETSYDGDFDNGAYLSVKPSSGVDLLVSGNYYRIIGLNSSNIITSFTITYGCKEGASAPIHSGSSITSFATNEDGFFSTIKEEDDNVYFTFFANTNEEYEDDQILPSELTIKDSDKTITASKIKYLSSTMIEAYFDLTSYASFISSEFTFHPHVYVRNVKQEVFNSNGDLRMATSKGNNRVLEGAYGLNNTYFAMLEEANWGENNAMPVIHFVNASSLTRYYGSTIETYLVNDPYCYKSGASIITKDGLTSCDAKIKYSNNGARTITFAFYSENEYDVTSYGIDMSWNNRWANNGNICYLSLNGSRVLVNRAYDATSWENGHSEYYVSGGHIKAGVNFLTVEGIYDRNGETNAANEGYELSLYSVYITNSVNRKTSFGEFTSSDYLKVNGTDIVNRDGDKVYLRGTNLGGYFVYEKWMTHLGINGSSSTPQDHVHYTEILMSRFGEQKTLDFFESYRNYFLTERDFVEMKAVGMTSIRLPFTYMTVDPDYHNVERDGSNKYNFRLLDHVIDLAGQYGIYIILDLHGAYGSQNGQEHSGQIIDNENDVTFYSNNTYQNQTIDLWEAITSRYIDNPTIAGFDILNEPGEKASVTTSKHWNVFDKIYDAIRAIDEDRIIFIESTWAGSDLPNPRDYAWQNVVYSFHHYTNQDSNSTNHLNSFRERVVEVKKRKFNIPVHMGEFTCYGLEDSWSGTLEMLNSDNWHYNTWAYKIGNPSNGAYSGWGIYQITDSWTDIDVSDYSVIMSRLPNLSFDSGLTITPTLDKGHTLKSILEQYF